MASSKGKTILRRTLTVFWLLAVLLVQNTLLGRLPIGGVCLFPMPAAVACLAMFAGAETGGLLGLCAGVFLALTGQTEGSLLLGLTLGGVLSGWLCDSLLNRCLPSAVLVSLLTTLLCLGLYGLMGLLLRRMPLPAAVLLLRQAFLSLLLCPGVYAVSRALRKVDAPWTE